MIEVIRVELIDRHALTAAAHESVESLVLEEQRYAAVHDVGVVLSHDAPVAHWIVGLADAREQHQTGIVERVGGEDYELRRLFHRALSAIEIRYAHRTLSGGIEVDFDH